MLRSLLLGSLCVAALVSPARANGRLPGTSTINFQRGNESHVVAGMTFGVLWSKDGGASWQWMCEDALPYGGMYDPDYVYTSAGTLFATTFEGLRVNRDGCTFAASVLSPPPPELKFFSSITQASDGAIYAVAADPMDSAVYKSTDDGVTFGTPTVVGMKGDWWETLEVAPSDPSRLYLSGYRFVPDPGGGGAVKAHLLFKSTNGGQSFTALPTSAFVTMPNSTIEIVGVGKTNPDLVFAKVVLSDNAISDTLYRSTDGGATWTAVRTTQGAMAFVVRGNGELVIGTTNQGAFKSTNNGTTWTELVGAPHINCLAENSAGEVWACTQNYGIPQVPTDGFGIMKSTDLATWTGVLKYQEIDQPVACGTETLQYTKCDRPADLRLGWCGLCAQLGCDPQRDCGAAGDGAPDAGTEPPPGDNKGCCDASGEGAPGLLALAGAVGMVLLRRRRRN